MRKNSIKNNRLSGEVMRVLSGIIRSDVKDPRVSALVSLTEVYAAPDLKTCKVYVSVLGGSDELEQTVKALNSASGFIRHQLAQQMNLRNTPEISFIADGSIAHGVEMTHRLEALVAEIPDRSEEEGTAEAGSGEEK